MRSSKSVSVMKITSSIVFWATVQVFGFSFVVRDRELLRTGSSWHLSSSGFPVSPTTSIWTVDNRRRLIVVFVLGYWYWPIVDESIWFYSSICPPFERSLAGRIICFRSGKNRNHSGEKEFSSGRKIFLISTLWISEHKMLLFLIGRCRIGNCCTCNSVLRNFFSTVFSI